MDLESPIGVGFRVHPDSSQVAAFSLGWVFVTSLSCIISSPFLKNLLWRCTTLVQRRALERANPEVPISEKASSIDTDISSNSSLVFEGEHHTLVFTLFVCFALASIAHFASLLPFDSSGGNTACAFVVALGGIAAQSAHVVGLMILIIEMKHLGISRWEFFTLLIWLLIAIVFIFVNNATSTGATRAFGKLGISLCFRKRYLPTALVSSLIYLFLELYVSGRLASLIAPSFLRFRHRLGSLRDVRIMRAVSLVILELLIIVPSVIFTSILADFLPFSVGSLLVLATFNHRTPKPELVMHSIPPSGSHLSRDSTYPAIRSTLQSTPWSTRQSATRFSTRSAHSISLHSMPNHPFSAKSLNNPHVVGWPEPTPTARSSRTIDSVSARSIRNAVVQVARVTKRGRATNLSLATTLPLSQSSNAESGQTPWSAVSQAPLPSHQILLPRTSHAEKYNAELSHAPSSARPHLTVITSLLENSGLHPEDRTMSPSSRLDSDIVNQTTKKLTQSQAHSHISLSPFSLDDTLNLYKHPYVSESTIASPESPSAQGLVTTPTHLPEERTVHEKLPEKENPSVQDNPVVNARESMETRGSPSGHRPRSAGWLTYSELNLPPMGYISPSDRRWSTSDSSTGYKSLGIAAQLQWPCPPPLVFTPADLANGRTRLRPAE